MKGGKCKNCGKAYQKRFKGHLFCKPECRVDYHAKLPKDTTFKKCNKCGKTKNLNHYTFNKRDGYKGRCRECIIEASQDYERKRRSSGEYKKYHKEYNKINRERINEYSRKRNKQHKGQSVNIFF